MSGYIKIMISRCQKYTYKPSIHRIKQILNCHYGTCVHVLWNTSCYYHCLLVSLWTLITVIPNDSLDFSVCKRGKWYFDSTWEWKLCWFWGLLHGTTCENTGMHLADFQPKHLTECLIPLLPGKKATLWHRPFLVHSLTVLSLSPHSKTQKLQKSETIKNVSTNASFHPVSSWVCISTGWTMRQSNVVSKPCLLSDHLGSSALFSWYPIKGTYVHMR